MIFFENTDCKYYPCHDMEEINCLFCYCPLYSVACGGDYETTKKGKKDCSKCTFPHDADNYDKIVERLK